MNYVERIFIDGVEQVVTAILTLIGISVILFYMHWKLAVVALLPIPFLIYGAWVYTAKAHNQYHVVRKRAAKMNAKLQDSISGIRETLSFNRQLHEIKQFEKRSRDYCDGTLEVMRLWAFYSPTMMFLGSFGTVLILLYGVGLSSGWGYNRWYACRLRRLPGIILYANQPIAFCQSHASACVGFRRTFV